jgi:S1-C subfamily serine protease
MQVVEDGPADKAGLVGIADNGPIDSLEDVEVGDVIVSIDGTQITTFADLLHVLDQRVSGQTITLDILRDSSSIQIDVTLEPRPSEPGS